MQIAHSPSWLGGAAVSEDTAKTVSYTYDKSGNRVSMIYHATDIADPPRPQHLAASPTITRPRLITVRTGLTPTR